MSNTRYIEITSGRRDRNQYSNPANFVMEISQSGQSTRRRARDPVSEASPILVWNNSFTENAAAFLIDTISVDNTYSPSNLSLLKITAGAGQFRQVNGFYHGAILDITNNSVANVRRRITSYRFLSTTVAIIEVDTAFDSNSFGADGMIQNPTPLATNTASAVIDFFIPNGSSIDNLYVNYNIELISSAGIATLESKVITAYNGTTRLATLQSSTTNDWTGTGVSANANSNFVIRRQLSSDASTIVAISTNGRVIQLSTTTSADSPDSYIGAAIRMLVPIPTAVGGFSTIVSPYAEERIIVNYITDDGTFTSAEGAASLSFTLDSGASTTDDFYNNTFITTSIGGITRQVDSYTGSTRSGTVTAAWGGAGVALNEGYTIRSAFLSTAFGTNPVAGDDYEIESYSNDNWNPFLYTGSLVSSQETVCYEIELINLILPNSALQTGGRVIFYPYLYVEFKNISSASLGTKGVIWSNNPNSFNMLFRAVVDDNTIPIYSPFVKIDGDGMVQTVKFKPNDSFLFAVYLPNGELFQTVAVDRVSPTAPDPFVQISAIFSVKRL
jgi:hypothetical protein